jgi:hypothetical protein
MGQVEIMFDFVIGVHSFPSFLMLHHNIRSFSIKVMELPSSKGIENLAGLVSKTYQTAYRKDLAFHANLENKHLLFRDSTAKIITQNDIQVRDIYQLGLIVVLNPMCSGTPT